ncbi:hypothetical protein G1C94_0982 [Bifidobacterium sp. DSM 109963]|uniref:Uncharacterized protein n=1 Tax=Bifidobacterium panos TaxID=2675321 RepID=A0ABX1SWZ9_9BIFI|nr:hypothetical protein [Bifidobacterium sp. DSM 109963]
MTPPYPHTHNPPPDWLIKLPNFAGRIDWPAFATHQLYAIIHARPALADAARAELERRRP